MATPQSAKPCRRSGIARPAAGVGRCAQYAVSTALPKRSARRVNREATGSGERSIYANGERSFAVTVKSYRTHIPIGPEPFDLAKPLGTRFCAQHVKAGRQIFDYDFGFDQPMELTQS